MHNVENTHKYKYSSFCFRSECKILPGRRSRMLTNKTTQRLRRKNNENAALRMDWSGCDGRKNHNCGMIQRD